MKNLFYSMMCLSALALSFSACDDDEEIVDPNEGNKPAQPVKLATPAVTAQGGEETFTAKWAAIENAEAYTVEVNGQAEEVKTTEITKTVAAGEYTIRVKATTTKEGYLESDWGEAKATVTAKGGENPEPGGDSNFDGTWTGTWKVSCTQKLTFTQTGTEIIDEPSEFEMSIENTEFEQGPGFLFYGWSPLTDDSGAPAPGAALSEEGTGNLQLIGGFPIGEMEHPEAGILTLTWMAPGAIDGDMSQIQFIGGQHPAFIFEMSDNGHAKGSAFKGELQGGGTFEVVALDIFAVGEESIYFMGEPMYAAGEFTMVKTADAAQAPQRAYAKAFKAPSLVNLVKAHTTTVRAL